MGLDISVYKNLSLREPQPDEDDESGIHIFQHPFFVKQADGLKTGAYDGDYAFSFRAGSYSGYNEWREHLCNMVLGVSPETVWEHPEEYEGKPFVELIHFADNEGTIGAKTAAKLLKDFEAFDEQAKAYQVYSEEELKQLERSGGKQQREFFERYFYDKYLEWKRAFMEASENGAVSFH